MQSFVNYLLVFHIAAGFTALLSAPIAIFFRKTPSKHRLIGRIFFYAMFFVFLSAIILSLLGRNVFLFLIAFFSFNFAWNGLRSIKAMKNRDSQKLDIYTNYFSMLFNAALILIGIYIITLSGLNTVGILSVVFGAIGFFNALRFHKILKSDLKPMDWLGQHIVGMGAAYIATFTAFSATNFVFLPAIIAWLWPTVIGTILLSWYLGRLRKTQKI